MRKVLVFFLLIINIVLLYGSYQLLSPFFTAANAALMIETPQINTVVSLNGRTVGTTPYKTERLKAGEYTVKLTADLEASPSATATASAKPKTYKVSWESKVKLTPGTQTVINRSFGPSDVFSAGEVLTLEKGEGLSLVSNPEGAQVSLDNKDLGITPLSTTDKGTHFVKITKEGYFGRELTINIPPGYRLTIAVNLALNPLSPGTESDSQSKIKLVDLSTGNAQLLTNTNSWQEGVFYYDQKTASGSARLDLLLDYKGATYSASLKSWEEKVKNKQESRIGYLGKKSESITEEAKKILAGLSAQLSGTGGSSGGQIQVTDTPTGFLNVRANPSVSATLVTKINPGDKYPLLEEKDGWFKIQVKEGQTGWISAQYAKKL